MSLRRTYGKTIDRPRVFVQRLKAGSKRSSLEYTHQSLNKFSNDLERPESLRRTPEGGSFRLTALSEMVRHYSVIEESTRHSMRQSASSAIEEINKLQWLLSSELPGISNISLPFNWAEFLQPRKTFLQLQADLEAPLVSSTEETVGVVWRPSEQVRIHTFIREMALKKLEADTFKKLRIIYNTHVALVKDNRDNPPPFSPFGWTVEDFIERRQERNTQWLDELLAGSEKDLEMLKFKCDMDELLKLLNLIFQGLKATDDEAKQELFSFVHDAYEFLRFPQAFRYEAKRNMEKLRDDVNTYVDMSNFKRGSKEEAYKVSLEQKLMDIAVTGPIELRYEVNWMRNKTDQAIMKMTSTLEEIEKKARDYRMEESKERYCTRCALDMYYLDIEKFKNRIAELSVLYDIELEKADNEIAYKKISMDKLRAHRKFLEEQIVRFQDEIDQLRRKEQEERQAQEEARKQAELRALEELAKKAKKTANDKKKKK